MKINSKSSVRPRKRSRLRFESLESRRLLATLSVTNTGDVGAGSLRAAIEQANTDALPDTIAFAIPGAGAHVISPQSALPKIIHPVTIDGYSQAGSSPNSAALSSNAAIMITLDGSAAGIASGLRVATDNSTIRGLAIHSFAGANGIAIEGSGNVVEGSFIGTDASGTAIGLGNGENGIALSDAKSNRVGTDGDGVNDLGERNVIVGNPSSGLRINNGSQSNVVAGNFLGVDATGSQAIPNASGILLFAGASQNTIGGSGVAGNVISGNSQHGVAIGVSGLSSDGNVVMGNFVGTDASGSVALPNTFDGILVGSGSADNELRGNVISGNGRHGVHIDKAGADGTQIVGNLIGTNAAGDTAISNQAVGVNVSFGPDFTEIRDNVISGNKASGIVIKGTAAGVLSESSVVTGNLIGSSADGAAAIPNLASGLVIRDAANNQIGSDFDGVQDAGEANLIAHNQAEGIRIVDSGSGQTTGNSLRGNAIFANGQLGIDLFDGGAGATANDAGDTDVGPNGLQNYPVIATAESGSTTRIVGSLQSTPSTAFALDFYASATADPSGFGEGQYFLGSTNVTTDAAGMATYDVTLAAATSVGEIISATATESVSQNTSEFSKAIISTAPAVIQVEIDVKPGNDDNNQNVDANGVLPVAILTTVDFDAADVDPSTIIFAGAAVDHFAMEDVDGDGDLDLLMHFRVGETNLAGVYAAMLADDVDADGVLDSTNQVAEVSLTGETVNQDQIAGSDEIDLFLRGRALREVLDQLFGE